MLFSSSNYVCNWRAFWSSDFGIGDAEDWLFTLMENEEAPLEAGTSDTTLFILSLKFKLELTYFDPLPLLPLLGFEPMSCDTASTMSNELDLEADDGCCSCLR